MLMDVEDLSSLCPALVTLQVHLHIHLLVLEVSSCSSPNDIAAVLSPHTLT